MSYENEVKNNDVGNKAEWISNFTDSVFKKCYICKESFVGLHLLTKHLRTHYEVTCQECPKKFSNGLSLHEHMRGHFKDVVDREQVNKDYACQEQACSFTSKLIKAYSEHMLTVHDKNPFECNECGIRYRFKANLEEHIQSKHRAIEFPCNLCAKKFSSKSGLFVHRREQHTSIVRGVKCDICDFVSKGERNLKKHKEIHNNASYKKYKCLYCPKSFRNFNSKNVHERIHTGEKPYQCNVCQKYFKRSHHLSSHLKCVDHANQIQRLKEDGKSLPDPIHTVAKTAKVGGFHHSIYMEVTDLVDSNTVQVVVPTEFDDQLLHSLQYIMPSVSDEQ